jgi:L-asparaginase II
MNHQQNLSLPLFSDNVFGDVPLAEVRRAGITESVHFGSVAVTNARGDILYAAGNPRRLTFARSALKPFLAAPFFAADGVKRLGLSLSEAALLCASHSGEARHAQAATSILKKAGADTRQLLCGCHVPFRFSWFDKLPAADEVWGVEHHNCSGKHAGFISAARLKGLNPTAYIDPQHPVQVEALQALADCVGMNVQDIVPAVDGCSAPTFAIPLHSLAQGFARLGLGNQLPNDSTHNYQAGLEVACKAMVEHPEMVSGEGRNDLALSVASDGDWVCKIGAEGVQSIAIRSLGLGIAIKVTDGNMRGLYPATIAVLDQLGLLNESRRQALSSWAHPVLNNAAGLAVGDIVPAVQLREFT